MVKLGPLIWQRKNLNIPIERPTVRRGTLILWLRSLDYFNLEVDGQVRNLNMATEKSGYSNLEAGDQAKVLKIWIFQP
jgi:hypothetical protein